MQANGAKPQPIAYVLRRTSRKTVGFRIDGRGLTVSAPRWISRLELDRLVEEKRPWIEKHLASFDAWKGDLGIREQFSLQHNGRILFRGSPARLCFTPGVSGCFYENDEAVVVLPLPQQVAREEVEPVLRDFLRAEAQRVFSVRFTVVSFHAPRQALRWHLSNARRQWGSCNSRGVISLSWRLIFFDDDAIDYVIAHELAHLVEMNHSAAFWKVVESIDSEWRRKREILRRVPIATLPI